MSDNPLASLVNLEALTEPVTKLIESVSGPIGILYEPRRIREKAKADVDAAIMLHFYNMR